MIVKAHAKVNLGLNIVAKRGDGYHEIDTLMARLELHDVVTLEPTGSGVTQGVTLSVSGADLPEGASNLAHRAAQRYLEVAGETRGVHLKLDKRIPVAAGLGGGSSDAAAVLRGLAELYPSEVDLEALAKLLGSDVPFFLLDVPAARARGRGEKLEPLPLPTLHLVLVNLGISVSAGDAYANLQNFSSRLNVERLSEKLDRGEEPGYLNALQPGVMLLEPTLREVVAALRATDLKGVMMSGSGSTCFGLAQNAAHAQEVATELVRAHTGWWVRATHTC